jgi:dTDP-6-deoxy-L-talose 4-dehydrogenase (NAD+)
MRVAITGATGFVGSHLVHELASRTDIVVSAASRTPPKHGALPESFRFVQLDIDDAGPDVFRKLGAPDVLIHLAWAGLPNYTSNHHFETELPRQYRFLAGLLNSGLKSLLCAGTCFEYGMRNGELVEDAIPDPQNPYAFAKDALRRQLTFLKKQLGYAFTWARLFYMFGPNQAPTALYSQLIAAVESGAASFKMSGGQQLRDYSPVETVAADLVSLALDAPDSGIVNICSGKPISVRALVESWLRERGSPMKLDLGHYPYPDYEPFAFWGSRRRLEEALSAGRSGRATTQHASAASRSKDN